MKVRVLLSFLALVGLCLAQQLDTGLLVGTVTDATGAVIPGANVTFIHKETGTTSVAQANALGNFRSKPLRIGTYTVKVETPGFKTYTGTGINLSIGDVRDLKVALQIGEVTEVVQV